MESQSLWRSRVMSPFMNIRPLPLISGLSQQIAVPHAINPTKAWPGMDFMRELHFFSLFLFFVAFQYSFHFYFFIVVQLQLSPLFPHCFPPVLPTPISHIQSFPAFPSPLSLLVIVSLFFISMPLVLFCSPFVFIYLLMFQLQFTFNIILYQFQVYSIVVRQSHIDNVLSVIFPVPTQHHTQLLQWY